MDKEGYKLDAAFGPPLRSNGNKPNKSIKAPNGHPMVCPYFFQHK